MAITIQDADQYVNNFVIDIDDWVDSDDNRKNRLLNVANTTLQTRLKEYIKQNPAFVVPDTAVYEFAATLSIVFNDQNKHILNGVTQLSASGIASFMFKQSSVKQAGEYRLEDFIPQRAFDIISEANGVTVGRGKRVKWQVL